MSKRSLPERLLYFLGLGLARLVYRVGVTGAEQLPAGGFLLLPNHISFVDAIVLQLASPRRIRFIVDESFYRRPLVGRVLKLAGTIPISSRRAKEGLRTAAEIIEAGEIVCLFPEGQLTRSGTLLRLQRGYELIARQAGARVVPVWLDQLWGSIFSFQGGRFFRKFPRQLPYPVRVAFGAPLSAEEADIATVREALLKLGETCYSARPALRAHLGRACLRGLKRHPFRTAVIDGMDHSSLSNGKLLGVALALARRLRREHPEPRIGVVLPPGKGGVVANLAVLLAGKVPVDLNFTSGRESIESAITQAGLRAIITAQPVVQRFAEFPWPDELLLLDKILPPMKGAILQWWLLGLLLPSSLLARLLELPRYGDRAEAVLLFTSGSSGKPKGVVLSHRNLLGNVSQFAVMLDAKKDDLILASLPLFHSFGCTVTLWYPLINSVRIVTYPSPLETAKLAALIERYKVTLLLGTPTFLRAYLRKAEPAQLRSLRLVIAGAEKLPLDLADAFAQRFGLPIMEGYGLTETAPVVSVNLPDPPGPAVQPSHRPGSTGKMAPGLAAEIRHPETHVRISLHETGMLWLRGPNIFEGYLHDEVRTAEVIKEGWFMTGDLGRFDEDGFLFIEGRLSRFSKIGGEMVPHEVVEQKAVQCLGLDGESERTLVVMGVPDESKGEALLLLSTREVDLPGLREKLAECGLPNLWIPRAVRRVEAIPVLASGKLDLRACKALAEQNAV